MGRIESAGSRGRAMLRLLAPIAAAATCAAAVYIYHASGQRHASIALLALALGLAIVAQLGVRVEEPIGGRRVPASLGRKISGVLLAAAGVVLWAWGTHALYVDWHNHFDRAWLAWTAGVAGMAIGLDLIWGRWRAEHRIAAGEWLLLLAIVAVDAAFRLGNIADFPGPYAITQIEDLQYGAFGYTYLTGSRVRWEFIGHAWLAAIGLKLGGPTLAAVRVPFAIVTILTVVPVFLWLRWTVGAVAAFSAAALLASSPWDVIMSRIPFNPDELTTATMFALLMGPARRGRPSAYVILGFLSGYLLWEYIAYRPASLIAVGALAWFSLRDRAVPVPVRLLRPLIAPAMIACMMAPLFLTRLEGRVRLEYFDGWNRARANTGYYRAEDDLGTLAEKAWARTEQGIALFFYRGDELPTRNIERHPLVDPVAATLGLLGIGLAVARLGQATFLLALMAFAVSFVGGVVSTGDYNVLRLSVAIPYVYVCVGFGAAAISLALRNAFAAAGGRAAPALLAVAALAAGWVNTAFLQRLWSSPEIRRAQRHNLTYLTAWLGENTRPGEHVLGIAPNYEYVLGTHDGLWLRGREIPGVVKADVESALRAWTPELEPTFLFVFAGDGTAEIQRYLETFVPGLHMHFVPDPMAKAGQIAWARMPGPPPDLQARLAAMHCFGVRSDYDLIGAAGEVIAQVSAVSPFVDRIAWPAALREAIARNEPRVREVRVRTAGRFQVNTPGTYGFALEVTAGEARLRVNDRSGVAISGVALEAGAQALEISGKFLPLVSEPSMRLMWQGPDAGNELTIMPLYRFIVSDDPRCSEMGGGHSVVTASDRPAG